MQTLRQYGNWECLRQCQSCAAATTCRRCCTCASQCYTSGTATLLGGWKALTLYKGLGLTLKKLSLQVCLLRGPKNKGAGEE